MLLLTVAGWSASGPAPGRFVPDEIIVKFRTSGPAGDFAAASNGNSGLSQDLRALGRQSRVRQMRPILGDLDRRQGPPPALRDLDPSRWLQRQEHLLRRQKRGPATARQVDLSLLYRVRVDLAAGETLEDVLAAFRSRPDVEYAERNPIIAIAATPNDPRYQDQWALSKINVAQAWDICRGSHDVIVAVIDTGVDYHHPDLQGNLWINEAERDGLPGVDDDGNGYIDDIRGFDFVNGRRDPIDDHGHGTACAGIIAAVGNNGRDVAGVCWNVRIVPVKILGSAGEGSAAEAVPAIHYAVASGADIISGSWGGAETSSALRDAIAYAHQQGVIVVAAAGNQGSGTPYYPAAYPEVIAVAATQANDLRWSLSNYGDWVNLAAPGHNILSLRATLPSQTVRTTSTGSVSGTSMAAPHVSGACALLLTVNPFLRCEEVQQILMATGDPIAAGICASNARLNVHAALRAALPAAGAIRMDRAYYRRDAEIGLLVADWHLRGAGQIPVFVETAGGDRETVLLSENPAALGALRGSISTRSAAVRPGDGILQVHDGAGIQARYLDADDGPGRAGPWRHASAVADYTPPSVVGIETRPQNTAATIELRTSEPALILVRYGKTAGGPYDRTHRGVGAGTRHTLELRGLTVQTRYYFVVVLTDEAGNEALADNNGSAYSFVTERSADK